MKFRPGFLLGALIGLATAVFASTLSWTPPTQRVDGTPLSLSEIGGYNLYCADLAAGTTAPLEFVTDFATEPTNVLAANVLENGSWQCALTTVDTEGRESQHSNLLTFSVGEEPPPEPEVAPPMPPIFELG